MLYDISQFKIDEVIIYLRKSRSDEPTMTVEEVLASHERQLQEYAIETFGESIPERNIFREVVSGETIADRPVMKNVMKLLETASKKACLVIEPQRLSRGDLEDCGKIINAFRYTNTLVMTPPKTYNLSDEYDRKFFEMELMRGNDYLEYTKRILKRGRHVSAKQGNYIGSVAPYGYKKVTIGSGKNAYHTLDIVPEEADALKLMYHLYVDENYGVTKIAHYLDKLGIEPRKSTHWSPAAIKDMLENPVYIGKIRWNYRKTVKKMTDGKIVKSRPNNKDESDWMIVDGKHQPIISEELFNASLDKKGKNPCVKKNSELSNQFAGLTFCGTCGRSMSYKRYKQYGTNTTSIGESMICNNQANCKTKSVKYSDFLNRVIELLAENIKDFEIKMKSEGTNATQIHNNILKNLENDLEKLKQKDIRQKDAYEDGIYTKAEYAERNAKLQEQISETMDAIYQAKNSVPPQIDYQEKIRKFTECINTIQDTTISASEKNKVIKSCIEKIVYYNNMPSQPGVGRWTENIFKVILYLKL